MTERHTDWNLRYCHTNFPGDDYTVYGHAPLARAIEKATGNQVKITLQGGESGIKSDLIWENVIEGKQDFGWIYTGLDPDRFSNIEVCTLPFLFKDTISGAQATWQLFTRYSSIRDQFKEVKVLSTWITQPYFIAGRNCFYHALEDLKDKKVRAALGPPSDFVKALGAQPVLVSRNEVNQAFENCQIDAALLPAEAYLAFKTHKVAPFITRVATVATVNALVMNEQVWKKLPLTIQEEIMEVCGEKAALHFASQVFEKSERDLSRLIEASNQTMVGLVTGEMYEYYLPDEEKKRWIEKSGRPVWEKWVREREKAGVADASSILQDALALAEQYQGQS